MKSCNDVTFLEEKEMPADFDHHYHMIRSRLTESLRCLKFDRATVVFLKFDRATGVFLKFDRATLPFLINDMRHRDPPIHPPCLVC